MGDVIKLEFDDPNSWTVEEALERALENVRSGKFDATKVYVALCGETGKIHYTLAGMQLPEVLGWLHLHMQVLMNGND